MGKESDIFEVESSPGENAQQTVEIITKDLEYHTNLIDKAGASFEDQLNFESSTVGKKWCQTVLHAMEKL